VKLKLTEMASIAAITALGCVGCASPVVTAPTMTRVPVFQTDTTGGNEAHMWEAEIEPGAETGLHSHPTPRFVYVIEGAVVLEIDGQPDRTFAAGEGFQEVPGVVHNFRNASSTRSARATGLQIAAPGQALQDQPSDQRSKR
jgi:quercetin dioxygenase-like cupin family protein